MILTLLNVNLIWNLSTIIIIITEEEEDSNV